MRTDVRKAAFKKLLNNKRWSYRYLAELFDTDHQVISRLVTASKLSGPRKLFWTAILQKLGVTEEQFNVLVAETGMQLEKPFPNPKTVNRRGELIRFHQSKTKSGIAVPKWLNLAAGDGSDLELCDEYIYFEELPQAKGIHVAVIRGDSMLETLEPGDVVVMEEYPSGKLELQPRGDDPKNSCLLMQSRVPQDAICVLSINEDPPTIKRVHYDVSKGLIDWKLLILADNMVAWPPRPIDRRDTVVFHAKVLGITEKLPKIARRRG